MQMFDSNRFERHHHIAISTNNRYHWRMIHSFSVSNYFSIREETVLDLRIPGTAPDLPRFRRSQAKPDVRLPTVVVLMGPNGSGKTTLLSALDAMARVASSIAPQEKNPAAFVGLPFLSKKTYTEPTRFCLEIEADWLTPGEARQRFRYEIVVGRREGFQADGIRYESLSHFPKGRPRRLFARRGPEDPISVASEFGLTARDERLKAVREDSSVVATLDFLNVPLARRVAASIKRLVSGSNILFRQQLSPAPESIIPALEADDDLKRWIRAHIQSSDLGIQDMDIMEFPEHVAGFSGKEMRKSMIFHHRGLDEPVLLAMESSGTERLFSLLPQIHTSLEHGTPVVLDEIDGDLHVDTAGEILGWFHSREMNPHGAQLLVSSHNVGLLDDLEKEEVFIVEKDGEGATHIHGAQDVRGLRRDARLYPKYRAGVLGGLPKIG